MRLRRTPAFSGRVQVLQSAPNNRRSALECPPSRARSGRFAAAARGVAPCAALRLYDSLASDLEARDMIVVSELADGFDEEATYRGARWFMYRTFVAHQFGYLGKGVRVRIPDCVVAAIRTRYPAPGCTCDVRDVMACKCSGGDGSLYRGHRDKAVTKFYYYSANSRVSSKRANA